VEFGVPEFVTGFDAAISERTIGIVFSAFF
jgi:hypothetical protein